jgi:tight adherence protein C
VAAAALATYDPQIDRGWQFLAAGIIGVAALYGVPRLWLQSKGNRRVQRIQVGLPDALDMTNMCLTGGLPLQPALARVSSEIRVSHADLALEFDIVRRHAETFTLEQALSKFAERIDVPEIKSLTAMVTQAERLGTNVARALGEYADSLRRSHRQRAEERGNAASVKMLLPVALCLAPPVYILLLAPPLFQMREFVVRENQPGGFLTPVNPNAPASPDFFRRYGNNRSRTPGAPSSAP